MLEVVLVRATLCLALKVRVRGGVELVEECVVGGNYASPCNLLFFRKAGKLSVRV
jgi:hypothetical protein